VSQKASKVEPGLQLVKRLFASFYSRNIVDPPSNLSQREFAFSKFGASTMIRHVSFSDPKEMNNYIRMHIPQHIFYSSAYYKNPSAQNMEEKGWLGADLIFDIDVDHMLTACKDFHDYWRCLDCGASGWGFTLKCPSCGSERLEWSKWVCEICINYAREEIIKLIEILEEDFGISRSEMLVAFSGHRGFHLHVESEAVRDLDQDARREISDYLRGVGLDLSLLLVRDRENYKFKYSTTSPGWAGRIFKFLVLRVSSEENVGVEELSKPYEWWSQIVSSALSELSVKIDEKVTIDTKRLIRLPGSLHGKTGLKVFTLTPSEIENYDSATILKKAIVFPEDTVRVRLKPLPRKVLFFDFKEAKSELLEAPLFLAVYMLLNGGAEILRA
jgi:DNA primase small subunit